MSSISVSYKLGNSFNVSGQEDPWIYQRLIYVENYRRILRNAWTTYVVSANEKSIRQATWTSIFALAEFRANCLDRYKFRRVYRKPWGLPTTYHSWSRGTELDSLRNIYVKKLQSNSILVRVISHRPFRFIRWRNSVVNESIVFCEKVSWATVAWQNHEKLFRYFDSLTKLNSQQELCRNWIWRDIFTS